MEQLNVSQLLKSSIGSTRDYEMNGVVDINDYDHTVWGTVRLMRTNRGILAKAVLDTESELTCSRCLRLFSYPLTLNIEEEYFPTADVASGAPLALPDEPDCFTIDDNNIIDLTEAIRQYGLLGFPMKPLCIQDCAGLCPACGINLNQAACDCPPVAADPRWSDPSKLVLADANALTRKQEGTD